MYWIHGFQHRVRLIDEFWDVNCDEADTGHIRGRAID